jgi:hypothetical protein
MSSSLFGHGLIRIMRSKASGKGKGARVAHLERERHGDVQRNIFPRNMTSLSRFRQESSLPSSSHESVSTHGRISSIPAASPNFFSTRTKREPQKRVVRAQK